MLFGARGDCAARCRSRKVRDWWRPKWAPPNLADSTKVEWQMIYARGMTHEHSQPRQTLRAQVDRRHRRLDTKGSVGYILLRNLIGAEYDGVVFPVNRTALSIQGNPGLPDVIARVRRAKIDLAIHDRRGPAKTVLDVVRECGEAGGVRARSSSRRASKRSARPASGSKSRWSAGGRVVRLRSARPQLPRLRAPPPATSTPPSRTSCPTPAAWPHQPVGALARGARLGDGQRGRFFSAFVLGRVPCATSISAT